MMAKYRKRPIIVDAERARERQEIVTLEGIMVAEPGDWIITGIKGERYPCKPGIFEATYESVGNTVYCLDCGGFGFRSNPNPDHASVTIPCSRCRGSGWKYWPYF